MSGYLSLSIPVYVGHADVRVGIVGMDIIPGRYEGGYDQASLRDSVKITIEEMLRS